MAPELIRSESDMRPSAMLMPSQMTGPVKTMRLNNVTVAAATFRRPRNRRETKLYTGYKVTVRMRVHNAIVKNGRMRTKDQ